MNGKAASLSVMPSTDLFSLKRMPMGLMFLILSLGAGSWSLAAETLFLANFEGDAIGAFPASDWNAASVNVSGVVEVSRDQNNWFGKGTEAKYLRVRDGNHFTLRGNLSTPREVVVLRFQFMGRNMAKDNRWLQVNFLAGDGSQRAHILSLRLTDQTIRGPNISYGSNDEVLDFSVILNNSVSPITYFAPDGHEITLASERADVWIDDQLTVQETVFGREGGTGPVRAISFQVDSTAVTSFDLGHVKVLDGIAFNGEPVPLPSAPMVTISEDGRLEYSTDAKGNRIPDFSNAGYMGGGVAIPEVPVKVTLNPQAGDDRSRIQAAINQVALMPIDEHGFRGAVLLKAGEYHVGNTLTISASGVVLRGEGDGPNGTVIHATGTFQHTLIRVAGSGGQWVEVSGTRRDVTDLYVPVGARSFFVSSTSGYQVGDTIIVYRPSTAEWISAIGMDEIPPRSDGLPVTQWTAGSRDLKYDRVITAIAGNRITIDAPLVNALERQYGGGYIFRYTFPGRISQVGIEHIRGVSAYAGGAWNTSQFDEDHAWSFIELNRVQNAWVRNTTALHFGFGNTMVSSLAKWVTVQDSQNLFPVSTITGSRRYPFYIQGQLSLVQRCYANYARHDYGTSSLTHGPNVFFDSLGEHSYSDTGPHHRWATGTLYDNIRVPNRDIAIQNRLNFGSGHGWAGANHVVWNSTANRIVVQNPPTAQNWAIGVIGNKWAGVFPDYAEDGYWISHGAPVEPHSLYLKQLEDRLAPEGTGGAITTVSFSGSPSVDLQPGNTLQLPVSRVGNRDGRILVQFVLEGDGVELLEAPEVVAISAHQSNASLTLGLREDVVLLDEKTVTVRLIHAAGYSVGSENITTVTIPASPLGSWRAQQFTPEQREEPLISGNDASPAGDGVENLLKYALNLLPFVPAAAEDLPVISIIDHRLVLTFARGDTRTDIDYRVEVSSDLQVWESGDAVVEELEVSGDGEWKQVAVADRTPVSAADRRFIRLQVMVRD